MKLVEIYDHNDGSKGVLNIEHVITAEVCRYGPALNTKVLVRIGAAAKEFYLRISLSEFLELANK